MRGLIDPQREFGFKSSYKIPESPSHPKLPDPPKDYERGKRMITTMRSIKEANMRKERK